MTPPHPALPHPHPEPVASLGRLPLLTLPQLSESETHNLALNYTLCSLIILCLISAARMSSGSQIALPGSGLHEACASCPPGAGKGALDGSLEPTVPHGWAWTRRGSPSAPSASVCPAPGLLSWAPGVQRPLDHGASPPCPRHARSRPVGPAASPGPTTLSLDGGNPRTPHRPPSTRGRGRGTSLHPVPPANGTGTDVTVSPGSGQRWGCGGCRWGCSPLRLDRGKACRVWGKTWAPQGPPTDHAQGGHAHHPEALRSVLPRGPKAGAPGSPCWGATGEHMWLVGQCSSCGAHPDP